MTEMSPEEIAEQEELAKVKLECNIVRVHFPTLEDVQKGPILQTSVDNKCPRNLEGICRECESFRGCIIPDGRIFAYMVYEGFCLK